MSRCGRRWFNWNLELQWFTNRVGVYLALVDDRSPFTDDHQSVRLAYLYPDAERDLNRWLPLVKWLLAIPHYVVLFFLDIAAFVVVIVAWFAILFPRQLPQRNVRLRRGVIRWNIRVTASMLTLVTDRYPHSGGFCLRGWVHVLASSAIWSALLLMAPAVAAVCARRAPAGVWACGLPGRCQPE
jgi:Domain of unknown function (DUF4389)